MELNHVRQKKPPESTRTSSFGSGLVGGEGLLGVAIAAVAFYYKAGPKGIGPEWAGDAAPFVGLAAFAVLAFVFARICKKCYRKGAEETESW